MEEYTKKITKSAVKGRFPATLNRPQSLDEFSTRLWTHQCTYINKEITSASYIFGIV